MTASKTQKMLNETKKRTDDEEADSENEENEPKRTRRNYQEGGASSSANGDTAQSEEKRKRDELFEESKRARIGQEMISHIMFNPREETISQACNRVMKCMQVEEEFWDEMSGKKLDPERVRRAREEEMIEIYKHEVYVKVPIKQCWERTGKKPIAVCWIDVNKGDDVDVEMRSNL